MLNRTTTVQNKIISIICFCLFFCRANIYRPSLGKVRLGRSNQTSLQRLNFYLRKKQKNILLRIACTTTLHCPIFNFDWFSFILKNVYNFFSKKPVNIFKYIYYIIIIIFLIFHWHAVVKSLHALLRTTTKRGECNLFHCVVMDNECLKWVWTFKKSVLGITYFNIIFTMKMN